MPQRITVPITRLHQQDKTACTHKFGPNGSPRPGEDCPGAVTYQAVCSRGDWKITYALRSYVEEQAKHHRTQPHPDPADQNVNGEGAIGDGTGDR